MIKFADNVIFFKSQLVIEGDYNGEMNVIKTNIN